uniref:Serine protease K12H4.7 n=1 Tax=Angiostrongylus cantonensis TaxID=6313 RepID=A0A158P7Z6_ANGCA
MQSDAWHIPRRLINAEAFISLFFNEKYNHNEAKVFAELGFQPGFEPVVILYGAQVLPTSLPRTQTTLDLKLLTIDQVIEDIQEFIRQMNAKYFNGTKTYWVTFGGSYSGTLSAFYRETYPETTIGAVSTSSAVNVLVDYYDSFVNMEANYRRQSKECVDNLAKAFSTMRDTFYSGTLGRKLLQVKFNLCDAFDENNLTKAMQFFFSNVYGYLQLINLYSGDNRNAATRNGLDLPQTCKIMTNYTIGDEMDRVKYIVRNLGTRFVMNIIFLVAMRSWAWQMCTELGYFQTTDGNQSTIFGKTLPVEFFSDQCVDLFGQEYTLAFTYDGVAGVRKKYGGASAYRGTNVVFPNGSIDPWKSLGLLRANEITAKMCKYDLFKGAAHCSDMYPASSNDTVALELARQRILYNLHRWIMEAHSSANRVTMVAVCRLC